MSDAIILLIAVPAAIYCLVNGLYLTRLGWGKTFEQWRRDEEWAALPPTIRQQVQKEMEELGV